MTRIPISTRITSDSELFSLCQVLAHERYQPTAIQILYFLLQPIIQHSIQTPGDFGKALRSSHGDSIRVMTFGEVPTLAQLDGGEEEEVKIWGVATLWTYKPESGDTRARFWISSEAQNTTLPASAQLLSTGNKCWQPDDQSIHILQTMCDSFFRPFLAAQQRSSSTSSVFFNGTNQCWTPTLATLGTITYDGPCTKAAKRIAVDGDSTEDVICPEGFSIRKLEEKDIKTVRLLRPFRLPLSTRLINNRTELRLYARTLRS